jgi:hypothetical protein
MNPVKIFYISGFILISKTSENLSFYDFIEQDKKLKFCSQNKINSIYFPIVINVLD